MAPPLAAKLSGGLGGVTDLRASRGAGVRQEEYYDYIFPEEQGAAPNLKILEAAYKWKRQKTGDE